jgi:hypothetical protein
MLKMKKTDLEKFAVIMAMLAEVFNDGKEISKNKVELYFKALEKYEIDKISLAASNMIQARVYPSFPKPAEILQEINGTNADRATEAWIGVLNTVKNVGNYQSVKFADPVIHSVINVMGGWDNLASTMTVDEEKWKQKEFERLYQVMNRRGNHSKYLPGTHELNNTPAMLAEYKARTGEDWNQEIIEIGFDDQKQITEPISAVN